MKLVSLLLGILILAACHTIHIKNGNLNADGPQKEKWHHIGILSLVEFSDPYQLDKQCDGAPWATVRTRQNALQVLLGFVPYLSYVWTPHEVSVVCSAAPVKKSAL